VYRLAGHRAGEANALNAVGWCHSRLGAHEQALTFCQRALAQLEELGDRTGQGHTWESIGHANHHLGRYGEALACYGHALDLYRETGGRYFEADTLTRVGETHQAAGAEDAAREDWQARAGHPHRTRPPRRGAGQRAAHGSAMPSPGVIGGFDRSTDLIRI